MVITNIHQITLINKNILHQHRTNDKNKLKKLLLKIINNIITNPNNPKYRNLNYNIIDTKFSKCKSCIDILICCGFYRSNHGDKLVFNPDKLQKLKEIKELLQVPITVNTWNDIKISLQQSAKNSFLIEETQKELIMNIKHIDDEKYNINVCDCITLFIDTITVFHNY